MPWFREHFSASEAPTPGEGPNRLSEVGKIIEDALSPAHFFLGRDVHLEWRAQCAQEVPWEIHRGRLVDSAYSRERRAFESWDILWVDPEGRSTEPILSVKLDAGLGQVHVTRAIHCYAWEGYHAGDNVFLSRETRRWVRELVGTIHLDRFTNLLQIKDELICLLFMAVVGTGRLPLTSAEAPLPAFSLGKLGYFYRSQTSSAEPMRSFQDLIQDGLQPDQAWLEKTKLLELVLRSLASNETEQAAEAFMDRWRSLGHGPVEIVALVRTLFNEVALSPYTGFVDNFLDLLRHLVGHRHLALPGYVDLLSYLLRQTVRHLTAYDLVTFHHRGANYPDALLLDAVLREYMFLVEDQPAMFLSSADDHPRQERDKRRRRRALRQGWLMRRACEGLPVTDAPTSPGENSRILPPPYLRVPEEQIFKPEKRSKQLFVDERLTLGAKTKEVLHKSLGDLAQGEELQELGTAVFLDRPLGAFKQPGEPDQTILFSYEAFSRTLAERRLRFLTQCVAEEGNAESLKATEEDLRTLSVAGLPLILSKALQRPGTVSLDDALTVADDFILVRSTRQSVRQFLGQFDFTPLVEHELILIVRSVSVGEGEDAILTVFDTSLRRRLELGLEPVKGYANRAGLEYPLSGLRVLRIWTADGKISDVGDMGRIVRPAD